MGGPASRALVVRPAVAEDLEAVGRMAEALVQLHHDWDAERFFIWPRVASGYRRYFRSMLTDPETVILVAERDGTLVGYAYGSLVERDWSDLRDACGKLHDLWVDPAARRGGVARALVEAAVARLEAMGAPRVVLMAAARNPAARALFGRVGFRETMIEMTREKQAPARITRQARKPRRQG